jgi:hypothetical protein
MLNGNHRRLPHLVIDKLCSLRVVGNLFKCNQKMEKQIVQIQGKNVNNKKLAKNLGSKI